MQLMIRGQKILESFHEREYAEVVHQVLEVVGECSQCADAFSG